MNGDHVMWRLAQAQKPCTFSCSGFTRPDLVSHWQMFSRWSPCSCSTSPYSGCSTTVPLHANSFLHARTIFFRSYSDERPCTVVSVLRPFRCWIRTWTKPSCTSSSELLIASANGSYVFRFWMDIRLNFGALCSTKHCDTTHVHELTVTDNVR